MIKNALSDWEQVVIYLALDSARLWYEYCLILLVAVYCGWGLTISWRVIKHACSTVAHNDYQSLLVQSAKRVSAAVTVVVLSDRGGKRKGTQFGSVF